MRFYIASLVIVAGISVGASAHAAERQTNYGTRNIVLVHDQTDRATDWQQVSDVLVRDGYRVTLVTASPTSVDSSVAATRRAISDQNGSVVLVGHSSGGAVVAEAGSDPRVRSLVYMAAVIPEKNPTIAAPSWRSKSSLYLIATKDGTLAESTQHEMAKRAGSIVVAVSSDRAIFESVPVTTAKIIEQGAQLPQFAVR